MQSYRAEPDGQGYWPVRGWMINLDGVCRQPKHKNELRDCLCFCGLLRIFVIERPLEKRAMVSRG